MKRIAFIMSLLSFLPFFSCANAGADYSTIKTFRFHYDGTIGGNNFDYEVKIEDNVAYLIYQDMQHWSYRTMHDTAGVEFIQALQELCAKHDVWKFNGFDEYNRYVSDGAGFSLYIGFENDKDISAHGMNEFPRGYREFKQDLRELFAPYCERMRQAALEKKKAEGVSGELRFISMNFIQHGKSGSNRYEVMLHRHYSEDAKVDITIRSTDGELLPEGEYRFYTTVPDKQIDWKSFANLVKKHHLVDWMDFDQAAEDYNNEEWFQMEFSFENGRIDASGTVHPEHYDAFRKDFLTLLLKLIQTLPS